MAFDILGTPGNDTLRAENGIDTRLLGDAGADRLLGAASADMAYVGGAGIDTAYLAGSVGEYYNIGQAVQRDGELFNVLLSRNGSGNQYIAVSTESVSFQSGETVANDANGLSLVTSAGGFGNETLVVPRDDSTLWLAGGTGFDTVNLNGNPSDYTLSRVPNLFFDGSSNADAGAYVLTAVNGSGSYTFDTAIDSIHFLFGQTSTLTELSKYVTGSSILQIGTNRNDFLVQGTQDGYRAFAGLGGY